MAKFKPGIPDNFNLDIEPVRDLGDYLDEPGPMPVRRTKPQATRVGEGATHATATPSRQAASPVEPVSRPLTPPRPVPAAPVVERMAPVSPSPSVRQLATAMEAAPIVLREERGIPSALTIPTQAREPIVNEDWVPKPRAPRREISMTPEAFRMSEELLEVIRSGSGQRDTAAKELVHALILLAHEVIDEIDPHSIPKRGRWGRPTARAYPFELKNAFLKAITRKHAGAES